MQSQRLKITRGFNDDDDDDDDDDMANKEAIFQAMQGASKFRSIGDNKSTEAWNINPLRHPLRRNNISIT